MARLIPCSTILLLWLLVVLDELPSSKAYITVPIAAIVLKPAILGALGLMGAAGVGLAIKKKFEKNDISFGFTVESEGGKSKQYDYSTDHGSSYGSYDNSYGGHDNSYGSYDNSYGGYDNTPGGHGSSYGGYDNSYGDHGSSYGGHGSSYGGYDKSYGSHGGGYGGHDGGYGGGNSYGGGYGSSKGGYSSGKGNGNKKGSKEIIFYYRKNMNKGGYSHHNPDYSYGVPSYQSPGYGNHDHGIHISPAGPLNPNEHGGFNGDTPPGAAEFPGVFGPSPLEEAESPEPSPSSMSSGESINPKKNTFSSSPSKSNSFSPSSLPSSFSPSSLPSSFSPSSFPSSLSPSSLPSSFSPSSFPSSFSPSSLPSSFSPSSLRPSALFPSSSLPSPLPVLPLESDGPSPRFPPDTDPIFEPQPKSTARGKTLQEMMADFFPSRKKRDAQGYDIETEEALSVEFLLTQALNDDIYNCAKMMLCGLGATPSDRLNDEEKAFVKTIRFIKNSEATIKLPLYQGMILRNLNSCQMIYQECPILLQTLLRSMKHEISRSNKSAKLSGQTG